MIVTEEAAKKLLCVDWALARFSTSVPHCLGSRCMAWRPAGMKLNAIGDDVETSGFCGKAYAQPLVTKGG